MAYERSKDDALQEEKGLIGKGKLGGLVRDPRREVSKPKKRQSLTRVNGSPTWSFPKVLSQNWCHTKVEICWLVAYFVPQYLKDLLVAVSSIRLLLADDVMFNVMEKISTIRMWLKLECSNNNSRSAVQVELEVEFEKLYSARGGASQLEECS